jgi:hypothetical protein
MRAATTDIHTWIDKQELAELVAKLSSAVDRGDHDSIVCCYADESFDDHGAFKGSGREFAEFFCAAALPSKIQHLLGQSVFELHGDEAWGETFFIFNGLGSQPGFGRYIDYFQRFESGWKLKYRRVVPDRTVEGDDATQYWASSRDRTDPLYDHQRWPAQ